MDIITITGSRSALSAIPTVLGFQPRKSLVLLWIARGRVVLAQRVDLPTRPEEPWTTAVVRAGRFCGADAVLDVWVAPQPPELGVVTSLHTALEGMNAHPVASIATDGAAWYSEGPPFDTRVVMPAEIVWTGPLREDFKLDAPPSGFRPGSALGDPVLAQVVAQLISICDATDGDQCPSIDRRLARNVVTAFMDIRVRDETLWHVCHVARRARPLGNVIAHVLRQTDHGASRHLASTCAMAYWIAGDGYRASIALERCRAEFPDDQLARMMATALAAGLPPAEWIRRAQDIPYDACRIAPEGICVAPGPSV